MLAEVFGVELELQFAVAEPDDARPARRAGRRSTPRPPEDLRSANLNARYTFEEFVIGNSNRFAHAAAQAVASARPAPTIRSSCTAAWDWARRI